MLQPSTIAIPLNTLQNDEKGKFVMVASTENGKLIAHKRVCNYWFIKWRFIRNKNRSEGR